MPRQQDNKCKMQSCKQCISEIPILPASTCPSFTLRDQPWAPTPGPLHNWYLSSFPGIKRPARGVDYPQITSADVKERVEIYSTFPLIFPQLRGPATALSRNFLHDLTTARHFNSFFVICIIRIFTTKIEKFQLRVNNSVCVGAFQLLRCRAPAQLRGNSGYIPLPLLASMACSRMNFLNFALTCS
jgi:hypothetical protein